MSEISKSKSNSYFQYDEKFLCPACKCNNRHNKSGTVTNNFKGCLGIKNFFGKEVCSSIPHLHIECWACKLKFIMWSQ